MTLLLKSIKWILVALRIRCSPLSLAYNTLWDVAATYFFLTPNLVIPLCPVCFILSGLSSFFEHIKPFLASEFCPCSCLLHSFTAVSYSIHSCLPYLLCLSLRAFTVAFLHHPIWKKIQFSGSNFLFFLHITYLILQWFCFFIVFLPLHWAFHKGKKYLYV